MNLKITKENHEALCKFGYGEYVFGSQLHGIATENSDHNYVRVISDEFYDRFRTIADYLPNIHSWQYDDSENNAQYVWMTSRQFYHNLFNGDGNMIADIALLTPIFNHNSMEICRTYKIIKGYLGVAKRDLKIHGNNEKKRFHAYRSIYMAECLIDNRLPTVEGIKLLKAMPIPTKDQLTELEQQYRNQLNAMLDAGEITFYPRFKEEDPLVQLMVDSNNIKEFKY